MKRGWGRWSKIPKCAAVLFAAVILALGKEILFLTRVCFSVYYRRIMEVKKTIKCAFKVLLTIPLIISWGVAILACLVVTCILIILMAIAYQAGCRKNMDPPSFYTKFGEWLFNIPPSWRNW